MNRFEKAVHDYWAVGIAVRHPDAPAMSTEKALRSLNSMDRLRPTEYKLSGFMHTLKFDIIEGHQEWREKPKAQSSRLIQFTRE